LHNGFYFRYASGFGYTAVSGSGPNGSAGLSGGGSAGAAAIGGTPGKGFVLAGVVSAASVTAGFAGAEPGASGNAAFTMAGVGVLSDWFPAPKQGGHVGGSLGLAFMSAKVPHVVPLGVSSNTAGDLGGIGLQASVHGGYDWWIGPEWSLGVMAVLAATSTGSMRDAAGNDSGYRFTPVTLGLEVTLLHH
jgi:hypothetical protein